MQQRRLMTKRFVGGLLIAAGLAWLAWVGFLGFALRDGLAHGAEGASTWAALRAFLAGAWHMLALGLIVVFAGLLVLQRAGRDT